jgi:hypothetical protein
MFNKGRGVSRMISDFIVSHPSMTIFELTDDEWKAACSENSKLTVSDGLNIIHKTATSIIEPSKDNYFTNESILKQFEHLITCIKYSSIFKEVNYRVDILVDNATTHTKAIIDVSMFNKGKGTNCVVDNLVWLDENENEITHCCYYEDGENLGLSKGLFNLCKELKIIPENMKWNL